MDGHCPGGFTLQSMTPVDEANEKMVRILLEAGANPNIEDDKLGKPLGIALNRNLHSIAELLIQFGALRPYISIGLPMYVNRFTSICYHIALTRSSGNGLIFLR